MSTLSELLHYQIAYDSWANQRALSAANKLTPEELDRDFSSSEKSIRGTLAHIYRAEKVWLSRLDGSPVEFRVEGEDSMDALSRNWPRMNQRWIEWSQTVTDQSAVTEITYKDLRNNVWTQSVWKIVLHVVNHSTHHRGQAMGFIRALGHTPPGVDSIAFAREGN
jgi:uncharacterized damage-inducible protein DinB